MTGPDLTRMRKASRLSVAQMARLLDVSRVTLYRWEAQGAPRRWDAFIVHQLREHCLTRASALKERAAP